MPQTKEYISLVVVPNRDPWRYPRQIRIVPLRLRRGIEGHEPVRIVVGLMFMRFELIAAPMPMIILFILLVLCPNRRCVL